MYYNIRAAPSYINTVQTGIDGGLSAKLRIAAVAFGAAYNRLTVFTILPQTDERGRVTNNKSILLLTVMIILYRLKRADDTRRRNFY